MNQSIETRRGELEQVIERGLQTFVEVGNAIREIRDSRLYADEYETFENYCNERWGWSIRRSQQMMVAAETASVVGANHGSPLPSERHARELAPLAKEDPDEARELWEELSQNGKLTAADIKQAVKERGEYKLYLDKLPPQTRAALEQADENDQKQRNVLRNSNQLDHIANIANKRGDEVAAEVAEKALTEDGSNTFTAYEGVKDENRVSDSSAKPDWRKSYDTFELLLKRLHELNAGVEHAGGLAAIVSRWPESDQRAYARQYRELGERVLRQVDDFETTGEEVK